MSNDPLDGARTIFSLLGFPRPLIDIGCRLSDLFHVVIITPLIHFSRPKEDLAVFIERFLA